MERSLLDRDRVGVQDAVLLEDYTSQDAFVKNLKKRFNENIIYTYIGQVIVSVNPYKELNIYRPEDVQEYHNKHFFEAAPHVFALTDTAYRSLIEENREQCILISGESGAGKTEASKKVLQYIAEVTSRKGHVEKVEKVKNKILQSNPVLEAFGNARTYRNDNSSRFGKYMDIEFNFEANPVGGKILNYLLEKSRVIHQVMGERNFHIFYQLLAGADDELLDKLNLKRTLQSYYYLTHGETANTHTIDDKSGFREVTKALTTIEFSDQEQDDMFKVVASILHLGNIGFTEDEGKASVNKNDALESVAELLGCETSLLMKSLTHRTREAKGDVVTSPLNRETAIYARDALAKAIYDRLFSWIVKRINISLEPDVQRSNSVIGILDIYGFEIFLKNSFEQLCINFCNEKLQQLFIELTLKQEQEEYLKEGIEWQNIEYFDNKIICDLIEEKHKGIISIMDEECLRPGETSDMTLLEKMNKYFDNHKHYLSHKKADIKLQKKMGRDEFQLIHYAGGVTYNIKNFIEKNNDLLFRDLRDTMTKSSNNIIRNLFEVSEQDSKKRPDTAITQFKNSMNNLMKILMTKEPNYIRCIKPNETKSPGQFNDELVLHQVTYLGLMENLRVRRAGFAYRRKYEDFINRYKCLARETWPHYHGSAKDGVQILICKLGYEKDEYRMGKTKLFIRFPKTLFATEDAFQAKKHDLAAIIQARYRGIIQRRKFLKIRKHTIIVQKCIRRFLAKREMEKRKQAAIAIRNFITGFITRNGPETELNKAFINIAKKQWLARLSKNLPKSILDDSWPDCPQTCEEASRFLKYYHKLHLARVYRKTIKPEMKQQFELKILAEKLFKGKKKSYKGSVPYLFKNERIPDEDKTVTTNFTSTLNGEKLQYTTIATKYDRHGYKPRKWIVVVTNQHIYLLETKGNAASQKHKLPIDELSFLVTHENDRMMMIQLPEQLLKKEKGDIILEIPQIIECVTRIINVNKKTSVLSVVDKTPIEHKMVGKQGIIDVTTGTPESIQKAKSGHLLITASP